MPTHLGDGVDEELGNRVRGRAGVVRGAYTRLYDTLLYYAILYCATLYCTILCYIVLRYAM